jgi:hypothetical protein
MTMLKNKVEIPADGRDEDDVAAPVGEPGASAIHVLTPEAYELIKTASLNLRPITPRMRAAIRNYRRLTGRSVNH